MHFGSSKKLLIYIFQNNYCRFSSMQRCINKCRSSAVCSNKLFHKNTNSFSSFPHSKHLARTVLSNAPVTVFQIKNLSNDVPYIKDVDQSALDESVVHEVAEFSSGILPNFVNNISKLKLVEIAQQVLLKVHEATGLPWWASIVLTSLIARSIVTLPLTLTQVRTAAKLELIKLELQDTSKRLQREASYLCHHDNWPEPLAKANYRKKVRKEYKELIVRDNCHPGKCYILVLIQIPLWVAFSFATRNLSLMLPHSDFAAQITYLELSVGGFGWVTNLNIPDQYMILPITLGLLNLAVLETHQLFRTRPQMKFEKWARIFARTIIVATVPLATFLPAATNVYWITSSSYGLIQIFLVNSTRLRRFFRIPVVESELKHPYQYFYNNLKAKLVNK